MISKAALHFIEFLRFLPFLNQHQASFPNVLPMSPLLTRKSSFIEDFSSILQRWGWKGSAEIQGSSGHLLPCCLLQTLILLYQQQKQSGEVTSCWCHRAVPGSKIRTSGFRHRDGSTCLQESSAKEPRSCVKRCRVGIFILLEEECQER